MTALIITLYFFAAFVADLSHTNDDTQKYYRCGLILLQEDEQLLELQKNMNIIKEPYNKIRCMLSASTNEYNMYRAEGKRRGTNQVFSGYVVIPPCKLNSRNDCWALGIDKIHIFF